MMNCVVDELQLYLPYSGDDRFFESVVAQAVNISKRNRYTCDVERIADAIIKEELEKAQHAKDCEALIDFNDEIVEIEHLPDQLMMDITVSRDNLFYANGILTKNSMGIPATADFMISMSRTEELDNMGQLLCKQLKNRYGNRATQSRFVVGVDLEKQTLYDVNQAEQDDLIKAEDVVQSDANRFKSKFSSAGFKV